MLPDHVRRLATEQAGVVSRRQVLSGGFAPHDIARWRRSRDLTPIHPGVYLDHTGEPSWLQRSWAAVLFGWPAALVHESAIRAAEGPGRHGGSREKVIHIGVDTDRKLAPPSGVRLHRLVRLDERVLWNLGPPRLRYEDAALDVAIDAPTDLAALGVLAGAVQSRRTTAARLLLTVQARARVPRRDWVQGVLGDVAAGSCSVLEHGYLTLVERPHGLPTAHRQRRGVSTAGVVYRDAAYAQWLLVELDGRLFHDSAERRDDDFERDLDAAVDGMDTRRLSWGQVFDRPCTTAGKVGVLLRRAGWPGPVAACGPGCPAPALWAASA